MSSSPSHKKRITSFTYPQNEHNYIICQPLLTSHILTSMPFNQLKKYRIHVPHHLLSKMKTKTCDSFSSCRSQMSRTFYSKVESKNYFDARQPKDIYNYQILLGVAIVK